MRLTSMPSGSFSVGRKSSPEAEVRPRVAVLGLIGGSSWWVQREEGHGAAGVFTTRAAGDGAVLAPAGTSGRLDQ